MVQTKQTFFLIILVFSLTLSPVLAGATDSKDNSNGKNVCSSNNGTDLIFPKGNKFRVVRYDAATRVYSIESVKLPGEGESDITVEALIAGVNAIRDDQERILINPKSIIQKVFTNDQDLPTLFPEERNARKGCVPAK